MAAGMITAQPAVKVGGIAGGGGREARTGRAAFIGDLALLT
jgi:hypothetical protein